MTKTITVNYPGGSYGNFLVAFLSKSFNEDSWRSPLLDHHQYDQPKQINFIKTHHNVSDSDQFNIKITYDIDDIDLMIPDKSKSIIDGALEVYGKMDLSWRSEQLSAVGKQFGFDIFTPIKDFPKKQLDGKYTQK